MWNVARQEGGTLAIFGTGNVGLFAVMAANLLDQRLQLAGELGATDTINSSSADVVEALKDIADGRGVDFAIDTPANPKILRAAVDALAITGTHLRRRRHSRNGDRSRARRPGAVGGQTPRRRDHGRR